MGGWSAYLTSNTGMGMWVGGETCVYISPLSPTAADAARLWDVGQIDWTGADKPGTPENNLNLFEDGSKEDKDND